MEGARAGVRQYNGLLNHLSKTGAVPKGLFSPLDEDEDKFDELGVACVLLNAYLDGDDAPVLAPPMAPAPPNMVVHSGSAELRELRDLLRERMPVQ